jgi:hypothetical protein
MLLYLYYFRSGVMALELIIVLEHTARSNHTLTWREYGLPELLLTVKL